MEGKLHWMKLIWLFSTDIIKEPTTYEEAMNKSNRNSGTSNNDGKGHRIFNSNDVAFTEIAMKNNFSSGIWILVS
jgi:hypothetical protein